VYDYFITIFYFMWIIFNKEPGAEGKSPNSMSPM